MRIFITGATGLIGKRMVAHHLNRGDDVIALSRSAAKATDLLGGQSRALTIVEGDPMKTGSWQDAVRACDAVINLAGASIADQRWDDAYKQLIRDSRVRSTEHVVQAIEESPDRPRVLINASAVGYYGDTGNSIVDESAQRGDDFLSDVCAQWEEAALHARALGVRVVCLRTGAVLDSAGGVLRQLMPIFKLGLGGPIGRGTQYFPWIHWRDVVGLIEIAIASDNASGALNTVAPESITNKVFSKALGRALHRPAILPVPACAVRLKFGEFARYVLISQGVEPKQATTLGYRFHFPTIDAALADLIRR